MENYIAGIYELKNWCGPSIMFIFVKKIRLGILFALGTLASF